MEKLVDTRWRNKGYEREDHLSWHACSKHSRRYDNTSEQRIFKYGVQKKEEVATTSLSAILLPEIPTCPGYHKNSTNLLDCSRKDRNDLICRVRVFERASELPHRTEEPYHLLASSVEHSDTLFLQSEIA